MLKRWSGARAARGPDADVPAGAPAGAATGPAGSSRVTASPGAAVGSAPAGGSGSTRIGPASAVGPKKGRPTPKRSAAAGQRKRPVAAPTNRREAAKAARLRLRDERVAARKGLAAGDERLLPARDAGPVRRYVRDVVDARRNAGGLFFLGAVLILGLSVTRVPLLIVGSYVLFLVMWVALVIDSVILVRRVRREVPARFPGQSTAGLGAYAVMRAIQIRRLRLPPPKVARGSTI